ncbi:MULTISPECIES: AAA family ATPase [unclassified Granulicatella]|uniref:ATP-binding protein n=1 Tax=unclassified Granulicatella TaxID=2630493 RepID=UPI001072EE85|nr:AAA family ATPase [Granulicatella sp. WM01]MBF0779905.1 AAA family ATPase [Granulicatella sp. 19428wC4_WM01]TFU96016.1 hypothetical protein E4T68_02235 [Granulicatella sp. WM01]
MRIKRLTIYGYGKWANQTFDFTESMVVFLGQNEAGKSTIQSFIRHILFGFPKIRKHAEYVPKTVSKYGGKINIEDETYGHLIIERIRTEKGASTGELTIFNEHGDTLPNSILEDVLKNISLEVYHRFFSLQLEHLHSLENVNKEDLNKYFLTIGSSGSDQLFHLRDSWLNESKKIYKPTGTVPLLNQKLEDLSLLSKKLMQAEQYQEHYVECVETLEQLTQEQNILIQKEQSLKKQIYQLEKDLALYDIQLEHKRLLAQYNEQTISLPKDLSSHIERLRIQIEEQEKRLIVFKERLQQERLAPTERIKWYIEHKDELKYIMQRMPQIDRVLQQLLQIEFNYSAKQELLDKERAKLGVLDDESIPSAELLQDEEYKQLMYVYNQLMTRKHDLEHEKTQEYAKISVQKEKIAQLAQINTENTKEKISFPWISAICMGLGSIGIILSIFFKIFSGLLVSVGACIVGFVWYVYNRGQTQKRLRGEKEYRQQIIHQLRHEQDYLSEYEKNYAQLTQLENEWTIQMERYQERENLWKHAHKVPLSLSLSQLNDSSLYDIQQIESEHERLSMELKQIEETCAEYYQWFDVYSQAFMGKDETLPYTQLLRQVVTSFKPFMDTLKIEEIRLQENMARYQQLNRDVREVENKLNRLRQSEQSLFQQYHVQTREQLYMLLEQDKQHDTIAQKICVLKEQLDEDTVARLGEYEDKESMQAMYHHLCDEEREIQNKLQNCLERLAITRQNKQQYEQDGTYAQLQQEYTIIEQDTIELVEQVGELLVSSRLIEILLQSGKQTHIEQVLSDAQIYFSRLTNYRYSMLHFNQNSIRVASQDKHLSFELKELSQGTLEQLYVAIRLAFIKNISEMLVLPILIDDCFVNFDDTRRRAIYAILEELSETHQIFYFTFNSEITNTISNVQTISLHV